MRVPVPNTIAPIVCSPEAARIVGAEPYVIPPLGLSPEQVARFITGAVAHVEAKGLLPVLTHGRGAVWALAIQPDAHRRR
jgi:hypothetical protein